MPGLSLARTVPHGRKSLSHQKAGTANRQQPPPDCNRLAAAEQVRAYVQGLSEDSTGRPSGVSPQWPSRTAERSLAAPTLTLNTASASGWRVFVKELRNLTQKAGSRTSEQPRVLREAFSAKEWGRTCKWDSPHYPLLKYNSLAENLQYRGCPLVSLGKHGGTRLGQNLIPGIGNHLARHIGIPDTGFRGL